MDSIMDACFSFRQSNNSSACAIWKIKYFSTLKEGSYESPEFTFHSVKWTLNLIPFGDDETSECVSLFLIPRSTFPYELQFEFVVRNESGKDYYAGMLVWDFSDPEGYGFHELMERQDLLDGKVGDLLPNDTLVVCCKMQIAKNVEAETAAGSEKSPAKLPKSFDSYLNNYRKLLESGSFSDVVLRIGEETIPAHKGILSAQSEVFHAMFQSNMKETQDNIVDLIDIDLTVAKTILIYIYTREIEKLSPEKTLELYVAADRYMLIDLKDKCRDDVLKNLSSETFGKVFIIAKLCSDSLLLQAAKDFFADNVRNILNSKEWIEFSSQNATSAIELLSFAVTSSDFFF